MTANSKDHKDAKEGKPKRKTIKLEIPIPAAPHVPAQIRSVFRKGARSIRKGGRGMKPVSSALRKGARSIRKGAGIIKKKLSVDEGEGREKRAWNLPGQHERKPKHHERRKGMHMHEVMSRREIAVGCVLIAAVVIALLMTRPSNVVLQPPPGGEERPFGWNNLPEIREKISFMEYKSNYLLYSDKEISLQGFLKNIIAEAPGSGLGVYEYFIVDDDGVTIRLIEMGPLQRSLFITNGVTEDLYNVTGIVKVRYAGFDLKVLSIEKA